MAFNQNLWPMSNDQNHPTPQAGMHNQSTPGGSFQQSQQSYSWVDDNSNMQHTHSQQIWSWQSKTTTPVVQSPLAVQSPQFPAIDQMNAHEQLHHHMHHNAINHQNQALAFHQQVRNNMAATMMSNMSATMQQSPFQQPQLTYQAVSPPQPQICYQESSPQQFQQQNQLTCETVPAAPQVPTQFWENVSQNQHQHQQQQQQQPSLLTPPSNQGAPPAMSPSPQTQHSSQPSRLQKELPSSSQNVPNHDGRFEHLERQGKQDIQAMNREGAEIKKRLADFERSRREDKESLEARDRELRQLKEQSAYAQQQQLQHRENDKRIRELEHYNASTQKAGEVKDLEIRRLNEQIASLHRSRQQDSERHSQQVADIARRQAAAPAPSQGAFDMTALQKVIRETQVQQLSPQDIERVIEDQVSKRLAGMATKADIQDAGAQMQNALSSVPKGLSEAQVQQAVNRELNNVMQDVARRAQEKQQQKLKIEGRMQNNTKSLQSSQSQIKTDFKIEELPDRPTPRHPSESELKQRAIAPAPTHGREHRSQPTPAKQEALPASTPVTTSMPSRSNGRPQRAALEAPPHPSASNAPRTQVSTAPVDVHSRRGQYAALESPPTGPVDVNSRRGQYAALEAHPAASTIPGNALAKVERPTPKAGVPQPQMDSNALVKAGSRDQALRNNGPQAHTQPIIIQRAQPQAGAKSQPATSHQALVPVPQRQLEAPPASSQDNTSSGMELVRQGRDVARK